MMLKNFISCFLYQELISKEELLMIYSFLFYKSVVGMVYFHIICSCQTSITIVNY